MSSPDPTKPALQPRRRWDGRSQSVYRQPTPVQKAAEGVMAGLGVSLSLWRTRDAIAHALRLWAQQNPSQGLEEASAALLASWRDYEALEVRFRWGLISFFGEGHWQKRSTWPVDRRAEREAHLAREARAGSIEAYSRASSEPEEEWPIRWN